MKRPWRLSLPLFLAALLLSACDRSVPEPPSAKEAPPAVDTAPETEAPEVPSDLPEGAVPLTAEEIAQVNEAFESVYIEENLAYANPICCFFTSDYHRPEEIGLSEFLRHFSPGEGISDEPARAQRAQTSPCPDNGGKPVTPYWKAARWGVPLRRQPTRRRSPARTDRRFSESVRNGT